MIALPRTHGFSAVNSQILQTNHLFPIYSEQDTHSYARVKDLGSVVRRRLLHKMYDRFLRPTVHSLFFRELIGQTNNFGTVSWLGHPVWQNMEYYAPLVTPGSYCLVQDGVIDTLSVFRDDRPGPLPAIEDFLSSSDAFELDAERCDRFLITHHPKGWLRRKPVTQE